MARGGTLVLGGGFAGSYVARQLGDSGATIVNPTNLMLYTPLLPEAAAGSVEPRHVTVPLRTMCPHSDLVLGSAAELDTRRRVVVVDSEAGRIEIAYADLVVALGSITRVPNLPGLREHALGLKDLPDAIRLRNHVLRQIELADADPESASRRLTFVLAGAGFAGVEGVAELNEPVDERGRVPVDETLRVVGAPRVWALGDCAAVPNEATPGQTDPATCQHALRQARRLAENLRGTPRPYRYRTRGQMATLGSRHGIALMGGMRVRGLLGWFAARGYHVFQLPFASRRLRVLADWTAAALFRRDVAELSSLQPTRRTP